MVRVVLACAGVALLLAGCQPGGRMFRGLVAPAADGLNTRDLIDPVAQSRADAVLDGQDVFRAAERVHAEKTPAPGTPRHSVLCLSGGGTYGAYSAGVVYGWTQRGDRPSFDVVTGISTGAIIAPMAFLGPEYDERLRTFYTTLRTRDLYRLHAVTGLVSESLANTTRLKEKVADVLTAEVARKIAAEHAKGRRLYVGTTELDGKRFVVWDMGEIAGRGTPESLDLMQQIILGSSAIPGFFPPARIEVTVDGKPYVERHVDGGVSAAIFFRPPYRPPGERSEPIDESLAGTDVYCVVAGKLYADPAVVKPRSLTIVGNAVSAILYSQARGDLQRIWTMCELTGMNFRLTSIPEEFPVPETSTDFDPVKMTAMFEEGRRQVFGGNLWRVKPPASAPGESPLVRDGTTLTYVARGISPVNTPRVAPPTVGFGPLRK
jgi:hypothetical protein